MHDFDFASTAKVVCRPGAAADLARFCRELGMQRPMLVTDAALLATGLVDAVIAGLDRAGLPVLVYSDVQPDPPEAVVSSCADKAREHAIDGVIGFGGGSSLDVAKLIAVLAAADGSVADYFGIEQIAGERLPLILVPTTAGTGSEVTPISIITTGEHTKAGVVSSKLLPDLALLDVELTLGLPPAVTAATGIDAMVHAIEAFTSVQRKNVYSDMLAVKALQLLSANLVEAVRNGGNREARSGMLLGAMMAGQAFANAPVAAVHALAYPLGGHFHVSHGLSNSLVLPHVLRFNAPQAASLYAELLPGIGGVGSGDVEADCAAFIVRMEGFISATALPRRLRDVGVGEADLPMLAADAMLQQRLLVNNPRPVAEADALAIYRSAY
ncbi:iron-containing alcohol dehydrogenase [Parahaliea maris]|uniref:Iron-containing alcohol dehydrogenase n=1 Tax=Parahaliea maris TaxID=2716870 RepID=A0A5C8ZWQ6_9GAMM|nr:iron-containing alcohol dehydrogenase [Parahaliea maris]TXS92000.1 iron-containing alcohol dehydrogenase [Parahaliea maris]